MPRPDQTPRLPKLPFLIGDLLLLAVAAFIIQSSPRPLTGTPLIAVVSCVALAAVLGAIPFITDYARRQDEALDERQRALEALGATVSASAEQIGIAANGLHEIAELVQKNLRTADQLPHKLQEKIGEFTAQLANARADETEELEKSLTELRAAESDRLAATADKIAKAGADLAKLEAASHQHLAAAKDALAQLATSSSQHFSDLATATTAAIVQSQSAAATVLDRKLAAAELALATTRAGFLSELDTKLAAVTAALAASPRPTEPTPAKPAVAAPTEAPPPVVPTENIAPPAPAPNSEISIPPAPAPEIIFPSAAPEIPNPEPAVAVSPPRKRAPKKSPPPLLSEPASIVEISPPETPNPEPSLPVPDPKLETENPKPPPPADEFVQFSPDELPPTPPASDLSFNSKPQTQNPEPSSTAATTDGATRLLVTAYIGIGNRLFIRGTGPGLSWEKGVPLQFVSIGKWRWETPDATAPVTFKLYKNDGLECAALGVRMLSPASQTEVTATF